MKQRLHKSDPFKEEKYSGEGCFVCEEGEGEGGRCRKNEITCKGCSDVYCREILRNAYTCGKWHMQSVTGNSSEIDPTLKQHISTRHGKDEV